LNFHQRKLLALINKEKYFTERFYLTGGTVLAEFYLKHRFSEDLDFFSEKQEVNYLHIVSFFKIKSKDLGLEKFDSHQVLGLFSFFLKFKDGEILKVDFSYFPFPRIEKGFRYKNIEVDSLLDIAVNKIQTIFIQPRARDFIDIYFIIKEKNMIFLIFYKKLN
jgi:predicted nucleotidyltransferase component of viral defense system